MTRKPVAKPNPQGKGLTPAVGFLLQSSAGVRLPDLQEESPLRIVEDYLSSLFVISCDFRFMPVKNRVYYIYANKEKIILSMIAPEEGGSGVFEEHMGQCFLKPDLSWSLTLHAVAAEHISCAPLLANEGGADSGIAEARFAQLLENLIEKKTGRRDRRLGYYQNVLNYALGKSVTLRARRLLEALPQVSEKYQRLLPGLADL